ncbi:malonate transporter [Aureimonas sp. SA4125]|uniref:AEC family transporter n=1 Tax=Aureimonas sp. SA4125 TaxID=2826993 RepID=UPI001CC47973|nr:AEC family transporter [Aureimonas sp. SA4125]BDA84574.1 malonate transporter [Aureimonas sp. SA4125]
MIAILGLIFPFFALIGLGYGTGRVAPRPIEGLAWLHVFVVYLALPAMFYQLLSKTPVDRLANPAFIGATTLATLVIFLLVGAIALLRTSGDVPSSTIQGLGAAYGNIGYMGPGLAIAAFGPEATVPVALIFCFDNTLHFILAPLCMGLGGRSGRPAAAIAGEVARKIFTHPFILATIVGVAAAVMEVDLPEPAERLLSLLANAAAPCALFAMGVTLALRPLKRVPPELGYIVPAKLVLHPLVVYLFLGLSGPFDPLWVHVAMLLACLPTATNVFVIAQQYGVWVERASAAVLVTTMASVVTVTLSLYLMSAGVFPTNPFAH